MTQDDVNRLLTETGPLVRTPFDVWCGKFAGLVAAEERQTCINILERLHERQGPEPLHNYYLHAVNVLRGEK